MTMNGHHANHQANNKELAIVELPFEGGQPKKGVANGPKAMIEAGLKKAVEKLGWTIVSDEKQQSELNTLLKQLNSEATVDGHLKNLHACSAATQAASEVIAFHLLQGRFALNLGGDHSLAIGTISALAKAHPDFCVLWIDAHADINTADCSPSGNLHGMPLSFVMGLNKNPIPHFDWIKNVLPPSRIAYIGLRDVDDGERALLKQLGILSFSMHQVDQKGIGPVVAEALKHINPRGDLPLHLSFDIDGLDPDVAPSTGTAVRGGLSLREGRYISEQCHASGCLVSMDVMEVNPEIDRDRAALTVDTALRIIRPAIGETLL